MKNPPSNEGFYFFAIGIQFKISCPLKKGNKNVAFDPPFSFSIC